VNLKQKNTSVWSSFHSKRPTRQETDQNYITTFHLQPLWSHYKVVPQLFCLKWRPATTKRNGRD